MRIVSDGSPVARCSGGDPGAERRRAHPPPRSATSTAGVRSHRCRPRPVLLGGWSTSSHDAAGRHRDEEDTSWLRRRDAGGGRYGPTCRRAGRHVNRAPNSNGSEGQPASGGHSRRWQRCQDELNDLRACTLPRLPNLPLSASLHAHGPEFESRCRRHRPRRFAHRH